jgi:bifunctional enzyme CysN/CysC
MKKERELMNIVIVGHVDHGKSTVIGRLLADTHSLPEGKLEQVRRNCETNAKPFEYAFLLDALKDEQAQGITIDTARCFFKTAKREYIIIDAPGHLEFLKNMISGAARAEAALLVIDAKEGVQENSKRHGFMLSMLGIEGIVVLVNKMDLVDYRQDVFEKVRKEYQEYLKQVQVEPLAFLPVSARNGANLTAHSFVMPWYQGKSLLEIIDDFEKPKYKQERPFRFPLQDIYKFTEGGDERRIFAGTVESGKIQVGDRVIFLPSQKQSEISTIEGFHEPSKNEACAGYATGFTLKTQVYVKPGELMCRIGEPLPNIGNLFKANIFWMGKAPMVPEKKYKLKMTTHGTFVVLKQIIRIMDAADLTTEYKREQIRRHDVAECVLQAFKPLAFDLSRDIEATGRFVIIDDYEIAGGGIITQSLASEDFCVNRNSVSPEIFLWEKSCIPSSERNIRYHQHPKMIIITGNDGVYLKELADKLEVVLLDAGRLAFYRGIKGLVNIWEEEGNICQRDREENLQRIGELAQVITDSGQIFITNIIGLESDEVEFLRTMVDGTDIVIVDTRSQRSIDYPGVLYLMVPNEIGKAVQQVKDLLLEKEACALRL